MRRRPPLVGKPLELPSGPRADGDAAALALRRVVGNFSWLSGAEVIRAGLSAATTIYLARTLGAAAFGTYGFALAVAGYFLMLVDGGLSVVGTRDVGRDRSLVGRYVSAIAGFRLAIAGPAWLALVLLTPVLAKTSLAAGVLVLSGLSLFTSAIALEWAFYGLEKTRLPAVAGIMRMGGFATGVFLLVHRAADVWRVPLLQVAGELAAALLVVCTFRAREGLLRPSLHWSAWLPLLRHSWPVGLDHLMRTASYSLGVLVTGLFLSEAQVGWFVAAQRLLLSALSFAALYFLAYLPASSRSFREGPDAVRRLIRPSLRLTAFATLPFAVATSLLAPDVIILVYGSAYLPSVAPLRVLAWAAPVIVLGGHFRQGLIAADLQRLNLRWVTLAAGTNLVLSALLAPVFELVGVALASLLSETLLLGLGYASLTRRVGRLALGPCLLPPLLATGCMAGGMWAGHHLGLLASVATGVAGYGGCLLFLSFVAALRRDRSR